MNDKPLPNGTAIIMILLLALPIGMFSVGMYCKEKDMRAKYHMHDCHIADKYTLCYDGLSQDDRDATKRFVEGMGIK